MAFCGILVPRMRAGLTICKNLIRKKDVARMLQISERQVANWMATGILRFHKVGRLVFFEEAEVIADIKRHAEPRQQRSKEEPDQL